MVPCLWSFFFPGSIMETNSHNGLQNRNGCAWYEASTQIYVFECVNTHLPLVHHEDALQLPALMAVGCGVIQTAALVQCPQQSPPPLAERSGNYFKFKSSVHAQQGILWRSMKNKQTNILFVKTVQIKAFSYSTQQVAVKDIMRAEWEATSSKGELSGSTSVLSVLI